MIQRYRSTGTSVGTLLFVSFLVIDSQNPAVQIVSRFIRWLRVHPVLFGGEAFCFVDWTMTKNASNHTSIQMTFQALKAKMLKMFFPTCLCVGPLKWKPMGSTDGASRWFLVFGTWEFWFKLGRVLSQWSVSNRGILGRWGYPNSNSCTECNKMCWAPVGLQLPTHLRSAVRLLLWSQPVNTQDACSLVRMVLSKRFEPTKWIVQ